MIIIRVELHSAITRQVTEIARMRICNVGGTRTSGNYQVETLRGRSPEQFNRGTVQRRGEVRDYPRLSLHVWNLVARALGAMNYGNFQPAEASSKASAQEPAPNVPTTRALNGAGSFHSKGEP